MNPLCALKPLRLCVKTPSKFRLQTPPNQRTSRVQDEIALIRRAILQNAPDAFTAELCERHFNTFKRHGFGAFPIIPK